MKYYWKITKAFADCGLGDEVGTQGASFGGPPWPTTENRGEFRMKDDDGIVYYHGEICGDYDGFEPLDDFGRPNAGCTSIEYRKGGEWRVL